MTVEQTDILGDEVLAEIQQSLSRVTLPFEVNNLYFKNVPALLAHAAALQAQLDALKIMLERESRDMQKWNNRANHLAIEGQELRARLAEVEQENERLTKELQDLHNYELGLGK